MKVTILESRGPSLLVEWTQDERTYRAILPKDAIRDGEIDDEEAAKGIAYGLDYEQLIAITVTPEQIATALRARGYWTVEDLERNWDKVQRVFALAVYRDAAAMLSAARRSK